MSEITQILTDFERDESRGEELLPLVYGELRRLAAIQLAHERPGQTLQPTALVHDAWLRLMGSEQQLWHGREHFYRAAAQAMRRILVENARRKRRLKHGGHLQRVDLSEVDVPSPLPDEQLLALDGALDRLAQVNPEGAELVQLCFFGGLTQAEAGQQLGLSRPTAERTWAFVRAWLFREVKRDLDKAC
jgi:RNA polymerase sigma factor (TIGR02999 family)